MSLIKFHELNEIAEDQNFFSDYCEFRKNLLNVNSINMLQEQDNLEKLLNRLKKDVESQKSFILKLNEKIIGLVVTNLQSKPEKKIENKAIRVEIELLSTNKSATIYNLLLEYLNSNLPLSYGEKQLLQFLCKSNNEIESNTLKQLYSKLVLSKIEKKVFVKGLNFTILSKWVTDGKLKLNKRQAEFEIFEICPEAILEEFCELYTKVKSMSASTYKNGEYLESPEQRRKDEEYFKQQGIRRYTIIIREENGTLSGFSEILTNIWKDFPNAIIQELTGVLDQYRGLGIAKFVKAKLIKTVLDNDPSFDSMLTINWEFNPQTKEQEAIKHINQVIGFHEHARYNYYKIPRNLVG